MTGLRCLSLHQPWASLVAIGVKTIETRSWATKHRGRIGIASTKQRMVSIQHLPLEAHRRYPMSLMKPDARQFRCSQGSYWPDPAKHPLGALVATANLIDCVPVVAGMAGVDHPCVAHIDDTLWLRTQDVNAGSWTRIDGYQGQRNELPYGDFTPGRWAWLLDDVKATTDRCPACWGTGKQWWWCDIGDSEDIRQVERCPTCDGNGKCEPIPVKGHQGLWRWEGP